MNRIKQFWPILFILSVWFIFASPYFLTNKVPFPSTYLASNFGPWNTYVQYTGPVKSGATPDVITQIYPWKKLVIESWRKGQVPLWNPYVFAGTPLLANYQSAALSPLNVMYLIMPFIDAWSIQILLQPLFAGIFMYMFIRSIKQSKVAGSLSAISFMFCGFLTTWGVYGVLGYAILFLPLALLLVEKFYDSKKWYFPALLSFVIPLSFFSGHFQTSLYFLLFIIAYCFFKYIQTRNLKNFIYSFVSIFFGLLFSMPQLLPSMEFYKESVRSALFQKTEAIPWSYLPTLIAPDFFGNPVTRNDWFGHYAEWNAYIGVIPLMLAFYSFTKKNMYVIFFMLCSIVVILLAFDSPLLNLLIALKIPVLSTSAASRIIVLSSFSLSVLAAFGLDNLINDVKMKKYKNIIIWLGCFLFIFALLWLMVIFKLFIPEDKILIALSNLKLPTLIFIVFIFSILFIIFAKNKKVINIFLIIILCLVSLDLLRFAIKWQPFEPREYVYPEIPLSKTLNSISGYNREFGNFDQEASEIYKLPNLEGYDPLYIQRYGEFIGAAQDGLYHAPERSVVALSKNGKYTGKIINFLGVKYIVHKVADGRQIWAFPFWSYPVDQFRMMYQDDKYQILINDKVIPRAFLVSNYRVETDKRKTLEKIFRKDLNLEKIAILDDELPVDLEDNSITSAAVIKNYESNQITIGTKTNGNRLLILTDPYYPGWKVYVDGRESKIYRADYAFRGVVVPNGKHEVVFKYMPESFRNGLILGGIGIMGVICMSWSLYRRKK